MKRFFAIAALTALAACAQSPAETVGAEVQETGAQETGGQVASPAQSVPLADPSQSGPEALAHSASPICAAEETPIFSCTVKGGKRLSVCGGKPGAVQYRFGDEGAAELVLDGGAFASVPYSGGGEAQIMFESGDTSYIVYSQIIRTNFAPGEPNNPAITDGVVVIKDGAQIAQIGCDDPNPKPIDYSAAEAFLPAAPELFADIDPSPARK